MALHISWMRADVHSSDGDSHLLKSQHGGYTACREATRPCTCAMSCFHLGKGDSCWLPAG